MSAYFIANLKIHNTEQYEEYKKRLGPVFDKYEGKYLALDDNPEVLEGEWNYSRLVLIEFPDKAALKRWYNSGDYQEVLKLRFAASDADVIVVE